MISLSHQLRLSLKMMMVRNITHSIFEYCELVKDCCAKLNDLDDMILHNHPWAYTNYNYICATNF